MSRSIPAITVSRLGWSTPDGRAVLSNLDLRFAPERTGIVGRTGVGKSTLLRLLPGDLAPSTGRVSIERRIAMLRQTVPVAPDETLADLFRARAALPLQIRRAYGRVSVCSYR